MSCEHTLNFGQWKPFSKNYKPIRVWLLLVYKFIEITLKTGTHFQEQNILITQYQRLPQYNDEDE